MLLYGQLLGQISQLQMASVSQFPQIVRAQCVKPSNNHPIPMSCQTPEHGKRLLHTRFDRQTPS